MNEIRSLLKLAARRLETSAFLSQAHLAAVVLAALAVAVMVADRLGAQSVIPWRWVAPALVAAALVIAFVRWWQRRRTELQVAMTVDERLDLREKLSTALQCDGRQDPFAQAAIEDAVNVAQDRRTHELASRMFKVAVPRLWWISPLLVLIAFVFSLLGPFDLFRREEDETRQSQLVEARQQAVESVEALIEQIKSQPELSASLQDLLGELTEEPVDPGAAMSPEQVKRDAIKKVNEISKRLEEIVAGEQGQTLEALTRSLKQLKPPQEGPAADLAQALAKGQFGAAQKALQEMMKQLESGDLTEAQKKEAAEQLKAIAEQLEKLAEKQAQLEQALQQAGLDPKLAQNPQALQQALRDSSNLNQQQIQQLQQMAQAQQAASQMCQGLGQACQQMAQSMQAGQSGQGGQQMSDQLSELEQMQMLLQQAEAAANAAQGQCQGLGQGLAEQSGPGGMGNRGQGSGGRAPIAPTPWGSRKVKADVKTDPTGDIIARTLIEGPQIVGESNKTARQIAAELIEGFDEAQLEEPVPRKYQEANKHYFGEMKKLTEAKEVSGSEAPKPAKEGGGD